MREGLVCTVLGPALALAMIAAPAAAATFYNVVDLTAAFGMTANALNSQGVIAGAHNNRAATLKDGVVTDYGTLGGFYSNAQAIADNGQIAGDADTETDPTVDNVSAFATYNGQMVDLGTLGGARIGIATDTNGRQVVGFDYMGTYRAFLYDFAIPQGGQPGTLFDLGTLGGTGAVANAINDVGQIAGTSQNSSGQWRAFVHPGIGPGSSMIEVLTLGGSSSAAYDINRAGQVIGNSATSGNSETHAFISDGPTIIDLGTLGGIYSSGHAINAHGIAVGEATNAAGDHLAFLYDGTAMFDLNERIDPALGITLVRGDAINDSGTIIAWGTNAAGGSSSFLLEAVAVPVPASAVLLGSAACIFGFGSLNRRRARAGRFLREGVPAPIPVIS